MYLFMVIPIHAEHMKFMGIPLTGTITQFQNKLTAKSITYDKEFSSHLEAGIRAFNGVFAGEKAQIFIYYNVSTKIVYKARVSIACENATICSNKYETMKSMLYQKYGDKYAQTQHVYGSENMLWKIPNANVDAVIGNIYLSISDSYRPRYYLYIDYMDVENYHNNERRNMNDL